MRETIIRDIFVTNLLLTPHDITGTRSHHETDPNDRHCEGKEPGTNDRPDRQIDSEGKTRARLATMPSRARPPRPAMYNTPTIRNGGFGALQVEAVNNRPLSIARRHLAASTLRMREIEPDELSSSEWVRFLVMEERERERWITEFCRRRRNSNESTSSSSSAEADRETAYDKAEEAREEAEDAAREERRAQVVAESGSAAPSAPVGATPSVSMWARQFDEMIHSGDTPYSARTPRHARRVGMDGVIEAPPTYETAVRASSPPPAYEPRRSDERPTSPASPRRVRFTV